MTPRLLSLLIGTLLCSSVAMAQSVGTLIKSSDLKSEPFSDAATVASLPESTVVNVLKNQGAWSQINASGKSGWVRMLNIRLGKPEEPATARSVGKTFVEIGSVVRTGTTKTAATTGVKGLSKDEIKKAKPNPLELKRLESFKAKQAEVDKFAESRQLTAKDVPEL